MSNHNASMLPQFPYQKRRSGLLFLRDTVAAHFENRNVPAVVTPVGLKYRTFTLNQGARGGNRVVFIPGEFNGEEALQVRPYGRLSRETRNDSDVVANSRELAEWERPFTVSIWAAPEPGAQHDEDASVGVVEDLFEELVRALHDAARATLEWGEISINQPNDQNLFGAELLVQATQMCPLFDEQYDVAFLSRNVPTRKFG